MRLIWLVFVGVLLLTVVTRSVRCAEGDKASQVSKDCDLIGPDLEAFSAADAEACQQKCLANKACRGISFISGWNHCTLKKSIKRLAPGVYMVASDKNGTTFAPASHHDYSGKDLKNLLLKSADACQEACLQEASCVGYTFIAGYDTCWLKKSKGKLYAKVFYCWQA